MTNPQGGRPSKTEIQERREKTRELMLKGKTPHQISTILNVHYNTALADVQYLQARYTSLIIHNSQLAKRQFARVEQLLDEINIIKNEYWTLYKDIQDKVVESQAKIKAWEDDLKKAKDELLQVEQEYAENKSSENRIKLRDIRKKFSLLNQEPKYPTYITARIDALKAILDRIDKEAKLLSIFNPQALIDKHYVSLDVLKSVMEIFKGIVMDLIPEDKRGYAFKRLKTIDIQTLNGEGVVDAEFSATRPKIAKPKEIVEDLTADSEINI